MQDMKTVYELDSDLQRYAIANTKRDRNFLIVFFSFVVIAFSGIFFTYMFSFTKNTLGIWMICVLAGLIVLALYIVLTSKPWHLKNCVYCMYCTKELIWLDDEIEYDVFSNLQSINEIACPHCSKIVAKG